MNDELQGIWTATAMGWLYGAVSIFTGNRKTMKTKHDNLPQADI